MTPTKKREQPDAESGAAATAEPAGNRLRLVQIRCGFAELSLKEAEFSAQRAAEARRQFEEQAARVPAAEAAIDDVAVKKAKEEAHQAFRKAVASATARASVENAAVAWLQQINVINSHLRVAQVGVKREREAADALLAQADNLADIAESIKEMADSAAAACREAREAMAASEGIDIADVIAAEAAADAAAEAAAARAAEAALATATTAAAQAAMAVAADSAASQTAAAEARTAASRAVADSARAGVAQVPGQVPGQAPGGSAGDAAVRSAASPAAFREGPALPPAEGWSDADKPAADWLVVDLRSPHPQVIVRLLRRESAIVNWLVDRLAGTDMHARSEWQLQLSNLVDAIIAAAIDDAWVEFVPDHPFWGQFTPGEAREIARGLTALGFRYDGMGGFADGRVPTHRDLALAVGSAALLPARVKSWPKPDEAAALFQGVTISSDAFIATRAPGLNMGELVKLLGRRAEMLADVWNEWPRVRPLLFVTSQ